jgi:hypothetical protein
VLVPVLVGVLGLAVGEPVGLAVGEPVGVGVGVGVGDGVAVSVSATGWAGLGAVTSMGALASS